MTATTAAYVKVVVTQMVGWIGEDAPRSKAARMLADWCLADGLNVNGEDLTPLILGHFEADPEPVPNVDYLPELERADCEAGCTALAASAHCPEHGVKAYLSAIFAAGE